MYLRWNQQTITDFSRENITSLYAQGYVFTRLGKGEMDQTRSMRVDLSLFELSSENRRILRKTDGIELEPAPLPHPNYHWSIGKLAKDFYDQKFGEGTFTANKIKELLTSEDNFNVLLTYTKDDEPVGYCIAYENTDMLHYSYPFYDLEADKDTGMGMMLRAILYAKEQGLQHIYLGSAQRASDTYKLQFSGVEWFDGVQWNTDGQTLKDILTKKNSA